MAKKKTFDPDIYEEKQVKAAEAEKEAEETFGAPETHNPPVDTKEGEEYDPYKEASGEEFNVSEENLAPLTKDPKESGYTHKEPKKDPREDNALKARAAKKAKEIEMTEDLKEVVRTLFRRLQIAEGHINHSEVGVLMTMLRLTETKNVWNQMDKIPNLKGAFEVRINNLKEEFKKILKLYALIKTNSYKVNMTMADLEEIIKRGEGK
jgi:hypothetical protein